jgi:hypothetical protein
MAYIISEVKKEYQISADRNPQGLAKLAYRFYKQTMADLAASDEKGKGKGKGKPEDNGEAVRRASRGAATPMTGSGGDAGEPEFTRAGIKAMSQAEYKKNRQKIWAAYARGDVA